MRFYLLAIHTLLSFNIWAMSLEGSLTKNKDGLVLTETVSKKPYLLTSGSALTATQLNKLNTGDFVSIDGHKSLLNKTITVNAINYVGLQALIGTWIDDKSFCYNFTSYTEFSISQRGAGTRCLSVMAPNYTYIVSPDSSSWVILISGQISSYVGNLTINSKNDIEIELYDSETGDILRNIHLRK